MNLTPAQIERIKTAWRADTRVYRNGEACPDSERIFDAAGARGSARQRREVIAHTARCGACAESWRAAVAMHNEMPDPKPSARETGAESTTRRRYGLPAAWGVAAAAVLALAVGIVSLRPDFDSGVPAPAGSGTLRGVADLPLTLNVADGARLPAEDFRLSWQPLEEGVLVYQLEVTDSELNLVYATETRKAELEVPTDRLDGLEAGSELHWYVVAVLDDGRETRSATRTVIID